MQQRCARESTMIFEDKNMADGLFTAEGLHASAVGEQYILNLLDRQPRQMGFTLRAFDDDFMHPGRRELVRHNAYRPPRRVGSRSRFADGEDFARRLVFLTLGKRIVVGDRPIALVRFGMWSPCSVRGEQHHLTTYRITTPLGSHGVVTNQEPKRVTKLARSIESGSFGDQPDSKSAFARKVPGGVVRIVADPPLDSIHPEEPAHV